ncbi:class E sortase [Kitasatospora camelliae]|uniref:Class E sortase n=1 Tax=Kitasatospora camelliae TaxID=3156397 RepID=A0AAU8JSL9_9ACTN
MASRKVSPDATGSRDRRPDEQPPGRRRSRALRTAAGLLGEAAITLGVLVALFAVYSLWWTGVLADQQADRAGSELRGTWSATASPAPSPAQSPAPVPPTHEAVPPAPPEPSPAATPRNGEDVGFLHVPAMGAGYQVLIRMGADDRVIDEGVAGVYEQPYRAAMPWDATGNFALAAHRDGHGAKFHDLDKVGPGDPLVVETKDAWYVYRVDATLPSTSRYDVGVIAPVPEHSPYTGPGRYITLTTCTPVYTSRYRMAVWGSLVRVVPVDAARTPPEELR